MKTSDAINIALNLVVVLGLAFLLLRPGGVARNAIEEYRAEARARNTVETLWDQLAAGEHRLDSAGEVGLVEFSDYECVYCQRQHERLTTFLAKHPGVGVVYRHFPLQAHHAARGASLAAICAQTLGSFRKMHNRLFETSAWRADTNWVKEAWAAGIRDTSTFRACLASPETGARLEEDSVLAQALGVSATPTFVHRRGIHVGMLNDSVLRALTGR